MAITKIHPIKSTLKKAIDYIVDPAKTDDKLLVSSFGCAVETADLEFEKTRLLAMQKGNNLAHQLIQAFEPGEVSYAQAHEIGRQLADEILGGKYEYVIATGRRSQTALISWMRIVAGLWFAVISSSGISFWQRPRETQALSRRKNLQSFRMPDIWACMAE